MGVVVNVPVAAPGVMLVTPLPAGATRACAMVALPAAVLICAPPP